MLPKSQLLKVKVTLVLREFLELMRLRNLSVPLQLELDIIYVSLLLRLCLRPFSVSS